LILRCEALRGWWLTSPWPSRSTPAKWSCSIPGSPAWCGAATERTIPPSSAWRGGASDETQLFTGTAPVTVAGVVRARVDATYASVAPGDLLTTSATPGYLMRVIDNAPGTIVGKALEALAQGEGSMMILLLPR